MLYCTYHEGGVVPGFATIAKDEFFVNALVLTYLEGRGEIIIDGDTYRIGSKVFQIYRTMASNEFEIEGQINRQKTLQHKGNFGRNVLEELFQNVTKDFLKGRSWGSLKEKLYNVYVHVDGKKRIKTTVQKSELLNFILKWQYGEPDGWLEGSMINFANPSEIQVYDISIDFRLENKGETKKYLNKQVRLLFEDDWTTEALEHFGKNVTSEFQIGPYGSKKHADAKRETLKETIVEENEGRIFISHSSKDLSTVELFVNQVLKLGLEIPASRIFCTSMEGQGVKKGKYIPDTLREELKKSSLALLFVSKNYKTSEVCLNELGAAWVSLKKENVIPILLPDVDFNDLGFLDFGRLGIKLNDQAQILGLVQDKKVELNEGFNLSLVTKHVAHFVKEISNIRTGQQIDSKQIISEEELELKKCFEDSLEPFNRLLRQIFPSHSDGIFEITDLQIQNKVLRELSKTSLLKDLWYRFAEGDFYVQCLDRLPSGSWKFSLFGWEVKISTMWVSLNVENQYEFILLRSEAQQPFKINSDAGGESYNVGMLKDGTVVSENERLNGYAIINKETLDLSEYKLEPRTRDRESHWIFLVTEYHKAGLNADETITFCKQLDSGEVEVNEENILSFLRPLRNHSLVRRWR